MTLPCLLLLAAPTFAADYDGAAASTRRVLAALVAADTTNPPGNESRAAAIGAAELDRENIPYERTEFAPGRGNLVARLKGNGSAKPLLLIAHSDVVGAANQAWTTPPHELVEKDGYLYGRGVADDLGMAAVLLEVVRLLHRDKTPLRRDVILAWTGDEESGGEGVKHLLAKKPESIMAGVALNEGGGLILGEGGKVAFAGVQVAEKTYQDYDLVATGKTGHSSVPHEDNAIYKLSRALARLGATKPPVRLLPATKAYFVARAPLETGEVAEAMRALGKAGAELPAEAVKTLEADPIEAANLRTTCVATLLSGGTRVNALPAEAKANVNCRLLPDETPKQVQEWLVTTIADPAVEVRYEAEFGNSAPSPVDGEGMKAISKVVGEMFPGAPVIPTMSRGATDSRMLRAAGIACYGIRPLAATEEDDARAHGIDERIPVASLHRGVEFMHRLVLELAASR